MKRSNMRLALTAWLTRKRYLKVREHSDDQEGTARAGDLMLGYCDVGRLLPAVGDDKRLDCSVLILFIRIRCLFLDNIVVLVQDLDLCAGDPGQEAAGQDT